MWVWELTWGLCPVLGALLNNTSFFRGIMKKNLFVKIWFKTSALFHTAWNLLEWGHLHDYSEHSLQQHTQPALLRSHQTLHISQETSQHHSSSWLNWCQRNDTAVSKTGEESFHSIFNAYPLSKQAINNMLTLRKLSWYSTLSHNTVITFKAHLREQQRKIPNTWPASVTGLADLKESKPILWSFIALQLKCKSK